MNEKGKQWGTPSHRFPLHRTRNPKGFSELRRGRARFATYRNEAFGVGAIFVSVEIAVQSYGNEAYALHAIAQLLAGINRVMEFEALHPGVAQDEPFVANASPIIKNFVPFHPHGTVRQNGGCCELKNFRETFFAQSLDQARSTRLQRLEHVLEDGHVLLAVVEIAEGGKHAEHKSEGAWAHKIPHVLPNPFDFDVRGPGFRARFIQEVRRPVNSGDAESPFCKGDAASAWTAAQVENRLACGLGECQCLGDLLVRIGDALLWEHEGVKLTPERVLVEPLFFALRSFHRNCRI
jgi:hypothetical protein